MRIISVLARLNRRYWGAGVQWVVKPDMSRKDRERFIHRKYVLKEWVSKSNTWELDMQKQYPLSKDELAVLDYMNGRKKCVEPEPLQQLETTKSASTRERHSRSRIPVVVETRAKKPTSRDTRWSEEIVCDGRSVAKVSAEGNRVSRLSEEKVINDGRRRRGERPAQNLEDWTRRASSNSVRRHSRPSEGLVRNINRIIASNTTPTMAVLQPRRLNVPNVPVTLKLVKAQSEDMIKVSDFDDFLSNVTGRRSSSPIIPSTIERDEVSEDMIDVSDNFDEKISGTRPNLSAVPVTIELGVQSENMIDVSGDVEDLTKNVRDSLLNLSDVPTKTDSGVQSETKINASEDVEDLLVDISATEPTAEEHDIEIPIERISIGKDKKEMNVDLWEIMECP